MSGEAYLRAQKAQALAADPDLSVFVTANAGSGKTKVLIDRIARLLLRGSPPSSFLCITYTKAAAAEMQRRLFVRLGGWCVTDDAALSEDLRKLTGAEAVRPEDLARARALFAQALETPGGLRIQTIHAFCERLLARFPLEARTPPGFAIADEAETGALIGEAWDALAGDPDADLSLRRLSARLDQGRMTALLELMAKQRGKLNRFAEAGDGETAAMIAAAFGATETAEAIYARLLQEAPWADLPNLAQTLLTGSARDQDLAAWMGRAAETRDTDDYLNLFLTQSREVRKQHPTAAMRNANPAVARFFSMEGELGRVCAALTQARAAERAADTQAALVLFSLLIKAYRRGKAVRAALDFDDLIEMATALLADPGAGPWVLYKLDGGIDHILIDEGQDTSPAQWSLLAPLRNEFFAGEGARSVRRTVFAVGDPKQSIYAFQGADPGRFLAESQALSQAAAAVGAQVVQPQMSMSFRSTPQVLQAVDATFAGLDFAGAPTGADIIRHEARRTEAPGCVEVWPIAPRPETAPKRAWDAPLDQEPDDSATARLARAVADAICGMIERGETIMDEDGRLRPMTAGDVLILVRSRKLLFNQLLQACKRRGLPVAGADRLRLRDDIAVQDALTLLRVALDPYDDLSLACLLKGPWLNLTDDERFLFPLAADRADGETLYERLLAAPDDLYGEAKALVSRLRARRGEAAFEFLSAAFEECDATGRSGWRRVFERLGEERLDPLQELLNKALAASGAGEGGLQAFLAAVDQDEALIKRELENAGAALRIMTVHGAKGLEAPVVFLPDTTEAPELSASCGLYVDDEGVSAALTGKSEDDPYTARLRAAHAEKATAEHWRLLYVAMTRARDRLIVCGFGRGQGAGTAQTDCWHTRVSEAVSRIEGAHPVATPFGEGVRIGAPGACAAPTTGAPETVDAPPLPSWAVTPTPAGRGREARDVRPSSFGGKALSPLIGATRFRRGSLIHGLLQRLPDVAPGAREAAGRAWLASQGVDAETGDAYVSEALGVIADAAFADAFGPDSRAEAPIVATVRGRRVRGVIDRLVVKRNTVLAIDFKTDRPPPSDAADAPTAYVLQMALYREALLQALPGRTVSCAFVWTYAPLLTPLSTGQMEQCLAQAGLD